MDYSAFLFATDLEDEGIDVVLDNLQERAQLTALTMAVAYHDGRDIFPHNPRHRMRFLDPGAVFFHPDGRLYGDTRIKPRVTTSSGGLDTLTRARERAAAREMKLYAWIVFLHADRGAESLDFAPRSAFDDPFVTDLCPANPDARAYAVALARDVARHGVDGVLAESLHYPLLEHGYHHERYFMHLGPLTRFLLGLCFCTHCLGAARAEGVDGVVIRRFVRAELEKVFEHGDPGRDIDVDRELMASLYGGELGGYLAAREGVVTSLVAEVREAVRESGVPLTFCDLSGAIKGFATGSPVGAPAPSTAWKLGVNWMDLTEACDEVEACAYAVRCDRVEQDLRAYRDVLGVGADLAVALRPVPPDCDSAENLGEKLRIAQALGARRADFYHYGLAPLSALDLIREAIASTT